VCRQKEETFSQSEVEARMSQNEGITKFGPVRSPSGGSPTGAQHSPHTTYGQSAGPRIRPCTSACLYAAPDHLPRVAYHVVSPKGHAAANQREPALFSESYNP
jgi:hypothetical protein